MPISQKLIREDKLPKNTDNNEILHIKMFYSQFTIISYCKYFLLSSIHYFKHERSNIEGNNLYIYKIYQSSTTIIR